MDFKKYKISNDIGLRIKNLPDIPNLSADELKEKFDALGEEIAKNINVLIDDITNNKIGSDNIADGAVTEGKIKYNSINKFMLKENSVETHHINPLNVTREKINDNAINSSKIEDGAVTEGKILDGAVTENKIYKLAVTEQKIANNAVTSGKIKDSSVIESKIASNSIKNAHLQGEAVTSDKIAIGAVTRDKIKNGEVTEQKIANNAVTSGKIKDSSVIESKIASNSIKNAHLQGEAVTSDKIAIGAVTSDKIDNKSIDFSKLDDSLADKIGKCDNVIVLKASDFTPWDLEYANKYDLSQITEHNALIYIDGSEFVSGENYALYYVSAIMSIKKYVKGGELFTFKKDIANATATLDMFLTENELKLKNEWQLIEDITLEKAVHVVNIPFEKLQYKEVHIEAVIIPTNKTITSQSITFGKSGTPYWSTKVSAAATGKIYAIMDVYLSPLNITIFDGTVSAYNSKLSGGSYKMSNYNNNFTESDLKTVCSSVEKRMYIQTTEDNPMAIGTQIKVWGR